MVDVNVRAYVTDSLRPILPKSWRIFDHRPNLDTIRHPVVVLTFKSYQRNPNAPRGPRLATFTLTVLEPKTLPGEADNALDDDIIDLLNAIDTIAPETGLTWSTAERGDLPLPGFDIEINIPLQPTTEPGAP